MKTTREQLDIINAYQELGSYRAAARLCGTTDKTVKRALARRLTGNYEYRVPAEDVEHRRQHRLQVAADCAAADLESMPDVVVNTAAEYAHHLLVMRAGRLVRQGAPDEIVTGDMMREVFGVDMHVSRHPASGKPLCVPIRARDRLPTDQPAPETEPAPA